MYKKLHYCACSKFVPHECNQGKIFGSSYIPLAMPKGIFLLNEELISENVLRESCLATYILFYSINFLWKFKQTRN